MIRSKAAGDQASIIGWSCRLPGASNVPGLWRLLADARCAVGWLPADRFAQGPFLHPRRQERGRSYTFAAGALEGSIWDFDPSVFRISPREAEQIDPQQRMLLQLTWEALEDAGIAPSSLAGSDTGVFIGGCLTDYSDAFSIDPAVGDTHFATGNALACLANRISYAFDLRGPSLTVDTACSSSLVALNQAMEALNSDRIDTAIVGGINLISSPLSYVTFSQASMLSPNGLCKAFDASADGFVRGEGGVVIVLRKRNLARRQQNPSHGVILGSGVNSDGRTGGISLPSAIAQEQLIRHVYDWHGVDPDQLAFVEAHGTGTAVGDPIEAAALGQGLGQRRSKPLLMGSIKTNIGHLEPASGLAGLLKAILSLQKGQLPASLHYKTPNPHIDFDTLNLLVSNQMTQLPGGAARAAGINSFGFGGTNAHVVVGLEDESPSSPSRTRKLPRLFAASAASTASLAAISKQYGAHVEDFDDLETAEVAAAAAHRRDFLAHRVVVTEVSHETVTAALGAFAQGEQHPKLVTGEAVGSDLPVVFVFTGNGGARPGMGQAAYRSSAAFRKHFDLADKALSRHTGWSLRDALFDENLGERLGRAHVVQPLTFAIQFATASALCEWGLQPAIVVGHSVGEIAAAAAADFISLAQAAQIIFHRSQRQEVVFGQGGMVALSASQDDALRLVDRVANVEIAAVNSPRSVVLAGPSEALKEARRLARKDDIASLDLRLSYPYHTGLMADIEVGLAKDLQGLQPRDAATRLMSTVTGEEIAGHRLDAHYWWRNVREPVRFMDAVRQAAAAGGRCFIEIGPAAQLIKQLSDTLQDSDQRNFIYSVHGGHGEPADPIAHAVAQAVIAGAKVDRPVLFGSDPGGQVRLPAYAWDNKPYRFSHTVEAVGGCEDARHRLAGVRQNPDVLEWRSFIDTSSHPDLVDHGVGSQVYFPGTGFLEIGFAVASQWLKTAEISLLNFEILRPLDLTNGDTQEVLTRISPASGVLEIFSRPRLNASSWVQNCRAKIQHGRPIGENWPTKPSTPSDEILEHSRLYGIAGAVGLNYGPAFALVDTLSRHGSDRLEARLSPVERSSEYIIDPRRLDACLHGAIPIFLEFNAIERGVAYLPVRIDEAIVFQPGAQPHAATLEIVSKTERSIVMNISVTDAAGNPIISLRGGRVQAGPVRRVETLEGAAVITTLEAAGSALCDSAGVAVGPAQVIETASGAASIEMSAKDQAGLLEGWATAVSYEISWGLARDGRLDPGEWVALGRIPEALQPWLTNLLNGLEHAGLAERDIDGWRLIPDPAMPASSDIVLALSQDLPQSAAMTLAAAELSQFARHLPQTGVIGPDSVLLSDATMRLLDATTWSAGRAQALIWRALPKGVFPGQRSLKILLLGCGELAEAVMAANPGAQLTVAELDLAPGEGVVRARPNFKAAPPAATDTNPLYDLILSLDGLSRLPKDVTLEDLRSWVAPRGLLVAIETSPSLFLDLIFGLDQAWLANGAHGFPLGRLRDAEGWGARLTSAGFVDVAATHADWSTGLGALIVAAAPAQTVVPFKPPQTGPKASVSEAMAGLPLPDHAHIHLVPGLAKGEDPVEGLTQRCLAIRAAAGAKDLKVLWLVFSGALFGEDCVATGAWAFSRTLANEFTTLDVRRVDLAPGVGAARTTQALRGLIDSGTAETEIRIEAETLRVVRAGGLERLDRTSTRRAIASRLDTAPPPGPRLRWTGAQRSPPPAGAIEIEVKATGVNFRDFMRSAGLLPDDILENGLAGPTLGLECAGRITRTGPGVDQFAVGDRVMALTGGAFASHVITPAGCAVKTPDDMTDAEAAAIPVVFLTAYYALVTQAKLRQGEWVLIHGGAGGVGLAAIQIAQMRGARVIATAGSNAKRALLNMLGVDHVLDSRSSSFVDSVMRLTGKGVDVVLNSLSHEQMEQSLACLAPFGRFVELGKRDFVENTHVGLRAFRNNVSYFSVDVDQLHSRGPLAGRILKTVVELMQRGRLRPIPYSLFSGDHVLPAFGLMQQSAHIGKIVVRPQAAETIRAVDPQFVLDTTGSHLVTGAFGGFGLETAKWLVDRGARHLVLLGRKGPATPEAQAAVEAFRSAGVRVLCDPCDVTDRAALAQVLDRAAIQMPPIVGVFHAAMVLDDCIIENLDEQRIKTVLEPKVRGIDNLHSLTLGLPIATFVAYSSVTVLIGNPGQGAYVAANAYLDGVCRQRRRAGLPGLSIGWGPIADVGVVARSAELSAGLQRLTGARALTARNGLELMARALARAADEPELAVMVIAPNDGSFGGDRLAVLKSPTYASLVRAGNGVDPAHDGVIDLAELLNKSERAHVLRVVEDAIASKLARVLRVDKAELNRHRMLSELGLDSLMSLELAMSLESAFNAPLSLGGGQGSMTVTSLARSIVNRAAGGTSAGTNEDMSEASDSPDSDREQRKAS